MAPGYISELITIYKPSRNLRSSSDNLLVVHSSNLKTYGARSFSIAAPLLWNSLPKDIRFAKTLAEFKGNLNAYLFKKAFV